MKRSAELAIASTLVLAGCTSPNETAPTAPEFTTVTDIPAPIVEAGNFPDQLPQAVESQIANVVSVEGNIQGDRVTVGETEVIEVHPTNLSGVRISADEYLSAGHGVFDDEGNLVEELRQCNVLRVNTISEEPTALTTDEQGNPVDLYGQSLGVERFTGTFDPLDAISGVPDVALLSAPDTVGEELPYAPPTTIYDGPALAEGTQLYAVNYEPTEDGQSRNPYQADLWREELAAGLDTPAILGAIVLSVYENGRLELVAGMQGYGTPEDVHFRGGASGGPFYLENGDLVGITAKASQPVSVEDFEGWRQIDLEGMPEDTFVQTVIVQPISSELVEDLRQNLAATPECTYPDN